MGLFLLTGLLVAGYVIWAIWSVVRNKRWNQDPVQQSLAQKLAEAGAGEEMVRVREIIDLIAEARWGRREALSRISHALTIVKLTAPAPVYERAKQIRHYLAMSL